MAAEPGEIAPGIWRWTARHPAWHPGEFGAEVGAYALRGGTGRVIVLDPILPEDPAAVWALLDDLGADEVAIAITIPYHVRDAEAVWRRARERGARSAIHGHPAAARRLDVRSGFAELRPGAGPAGIEPLAIGKPRRYEMPLHLPEHRAIAFGDSLVVTPERELRIWHADGRVDDARARWYRERFAPTLAPALHLPLDHVLVTHGEPVVGGGRAALEAALRARPW
jgi:hypothetical protein